LAWWGRGLWSQCRAASAASSPSRPPIGIEPAEIESRGLCVLAAHSQFQPVREPRPMRLPDLTREILERQRSDGALEEARVSAL
jgi:hypothetical protein